MRIDDSQREVSPDPLERVLASFVPAAPEVDRDRIMFLAGMRAANAVVPVAGPLQSRLNRIWPVLAVAASAAALLMAVLWWQRPERIVVIHGPSHPPVSSGNEIVPEVATPTQAIAIREEIPVTEIDPAANYVLRRDRLLRHGVDSLAQAQPVGGYLATAPVTRQEWLEELSGLPSRQPGKQIQSEHWWPEWLLGGSL